MRRHVPAAGIATLVAAVVIGIVTATSEQPPTRWGGAGAIYYYGSFGEWRANAAAQDSSIAIVRITSVSDLRWSTASGERPSQDDIDLLNRGAASFTIGRLITSELVRQVDGRWPSVVHTADFFLPGGQIGSDYTAPSELLHHLPLPKVGDVAVATVLPTQVDLDEGRGTLMVEIGAIFPVTKSGFVMTPDHAEAIKVDQLAGG